MIDFILCIGDDRSDEDMFNVVNNFADHQGMSTSMLDDDEGLESYDGRARRMSFTGDHSQSGSSFLMKKGSLTLEEFNPADQAKSSKFYTAAVGRKQSSARYFVNDVREVSSLIEKLAQETKCLHMSRYSSMPQMAMSIDSDG